MLDQIPAIGGGYSSLHCLDETRFVLQIEAQDFLCERIGVASLPRASSESSASCSGLRCISMCSSVGKRPLSMLGYPSSLARSNPVRFIIARMGTNPSPLRQSPHLRLHCVNVFVRDQDRSLRFFVDLLGFHVAYDTRLQSGDRWVAVAPPDGSAILSLVAPKPNSEQYKLIGRSTNVVFVTEDVTSKFLEWSKRGVRFQTTPRLKRIRYQSQAQSAATAGADQPATNRSDTTSSATPSASGMLLGDESPVWGGVFARFRDIDGNSCAIRSH